MWPSGAGAPRAACCARAARDRTAHRSPACFAINIICDETALPPRVCHLQWRPNGGGDMLIKSLSFQRIDIIKSPLYV